MNDLLIHDCTLLKTTARCVNTIPHQDIVIRANKITEISNTAPLHSRHAAETIDAHGMLAMPGLINTHAHVPMVIFRGLAEDVNINTWFNDFMWPLEQNLTPDDVYWGMLLGLVEMIEGGVTTVADHYFHMDRAARAVEEAGTRAALGWAVFGSQGEEGLNCSAKFTSEYQGAAGGRITTWLAPHAPYTCSPEFLAVCAKTASQLNTGIHIHASETRDQTEASIRNYGKTPIEILRDTGILDRQTIIAHGCGITESDIEILKTHPTGIAHAPKTYLKLAMGIAPVTRLMAEGIPVGLATDGAVSNNTLDIWESMRLMALCQKHESGRPETMSIPETLNLALDGSARTLGMADSIGRIEEGYLADIILLDMNGTHMQPIHNIAANLVYSARASDVRTVIVDGKVLMRDRTLLTLDKAEIIRQVCLSMDRLSKRVPEQRIQTYRP